MNGSRVRSRIAALALALALPTPVPAQEAPGTAAPASGHIDPKEQRIWVSARVNDRPVRLCLDTGAEVCVLLRGAAERLGLAVTKAEPGGPVPPGKVALDRTETCTVDLGDRKFCGATWAVLAIAPPLERGIDGILGWNFLARGILAIDWDERAVRFLSELPEGIAGWRRWKMRAESEALIVEIPSGETEPLAALLDTGDAGGVSLGAAAWARWKDANPSAPATLVGGYSPGYGFFVEPIRWARRLVLGDLEIEGMPVGSTRHPMLEAWRCGATIGLVGLSRFHLVIDGPGRTVYLRPRAKFAWKFACNRLGAVFLPESLEGTRLIAHVVPDSPAARAGIRPGDELLKIGGLDVTAWRTDPKVLPLSRFWEQPAGAALELTIARGSELTTLVVKLEEIFPDARRFDPE